MPSNLGTYAFLVRSMLTHIAHLRKNCVRRDRATEELHRSLDTALFHQPDCVSAYSQQTCESKFESLLDFFEKRMLLRYTSRHYGSSTASRNYTHSPVVLIALAANF